MLKFEFLERYLRNSRYGATMSDVRFRSPKSTYTIRNKNSSYDISGLTGKELIQLIKERELENTKLDYVRLEYIINHPNVNERVSITAFDNVKGDLCNEF